MDPVLYWNAILLEASRRDFTHGFMNAQQPGPVRTSRAMAIVHLAIHDTVAYRTGTPNASYLVKKGLSPAIGTPTSGNLSGMIAGAAATALQALYPKYESFIKDSIGPVSSADFAFGKSVADAILAHRMDDGWNTMIAANQVEMPGYSQHRADPFQPNQNRLGPVWGNVTRFSNPAHQPMNDYPGHGLSDLLADPDYKDDFEEARDFGGANRGKRTAEQQLIGVYWGYDGAMNLGVPPRLYNQIARKIVDGSGLNTAKLAELFALINVAMADAGIDAWHYKYNYNLWRPVVGIRNEHLPNNDPFWAPLGAPQTNTAGRPTTLTPNFPAYPSGHATFGAALFQALRLSLKTGGPTTAPITVQDVLNVPLHSIAPNPSERFTFISDELDGVATDPDGSTRTLVERQFDTFAEAIWENAISRVYLGVHWRFDGLPKVANKKIGGVPLGLAIGEEAYALFNTAPSLD
jgi:hypothetical protein